MMFYDASFGDGRKAPVTHERMTEFQAIVLAGHGNRMSPLTNEENLPKALLPVANKPLLWYPLNWLEKAGIKDIIVIAPSSAGAKISHYLTSVYKKTSHVELVALEGYVGTVEALRQVKDKIRHDFIVMSCDLVFDLVPHDFLNFHRANDSTMTSLFYEPIKSEGGGSGRDDDDMNQYVGVDPKDSRLIYSKAAIDVSDELVFRMSLLWKHPCINVYTTLRDAHLYIFKRWVMDLIMKKDKFLSIREDLVPYLTKIQYQTGLIEKDEIEKLITPSSNQQDPFEYSSSRRVLEQDLVKCQVYFHRGGLCGRVNTVGTYFDMNRHMAKTTTDIRVPSSADINPKTQIGADSIVGEGSRMGEKCSVKKSIIGAHCIIGKNVKISNTILMDYVQVEDGVKLDGCVVCNGAKIHEKAQLKDCEVGANVVVEKDTQAKSERFMDYPETNE
ncbi:Translation initiation factor eIF-2B subunit gamma [Basidiobolus ranarum]|uniref:Translation initiation factor eIF2B subunit gamma n=1 Tax=Basidiobolus ranarum TaxID=34480 RepID=A0ABR2X4I3_9FUNG